MARAKLPPGMTALEDELRAQAFERRIGIAWCIAVAMIIIVLFMAGAVQHGYLH